MKKTILLVLCISLLCCERRVKDYAKHISHSLLESQQFVYAPLGQLAPGPVFSADSTFIGIAPFADSNVHDIFIQAENFTDKACKSFFSPGYFRLDNAQGEKLELAVTTDRFLIRLSSANNRIYIQLPDSTFHIQNNHLSGIYHDKSFYVIAQQQTSCDSLTYSTDESELLIYFTLMDDKTLNWNFEHFYLNTLQLWNRALNSITYKARDKKSRGPFFTALYQAMYAPQADSFDSNYAEFLLTHIEKNEHTQYLFQQLGLQRQDGYFTFVPPACRTAVIHFSNPVFIENQVAKKTEYIFWNDQNISQLSAKQLLSGGTLLFK